MPKRLLHHVAPMLLAALLVGGAHAVTVSRLQVRIVTGAQELVAGSTVELRIYEAGGGMRRLSLAHGEAWPRDSTRVVELSLPQPLDSRTVTRFAIYYHAATPLAPPWEVASAQVQLPSASGEPQRLLDATLEGVIAGAGELATIEREPGELLCRSDADCDDHLACDGRERCAPHAAGADARGCVRGQPMMCPVNQVCVETRGCVGLDGKAAAPPKAP